MLWFISHLQLSNVIKICLFLINPYFQSFNWHLLIRLFLYAYLKLYHGFQDCCLIQSLLKNRVIWSHTFSVHPVIPFPLHSSLFVPQLYLLPVFPILLLSSLFVPQLYLLPVFPLPLLSSLFVPQSYLLPVFPIPLLSSLFVPQSYLLPVFPIPLLSSLFVPQYFLLPVFTIPVMSLFVPQSYLRPVSRSQLYMTAHAGPRRCECHPGTKFRHPPVEVTQFWHPKSGYGARFL